MLLFRIPYFCIPTVKCVCLTSTTRCTKYQDTTVYNNCMYIQ